jgi:nitroreductase
MEFEAVIRGRRSIRRFKPEPPPRELVREILDEARWSPSITNTQPWRIYVVTGETLARLKKGYETAGERETPAAPDFPMPREWPAHLAARTKELFTVRAAAAPDFAPGSGAKLPEFHGAPCVLFFAVDEGTPTEHILFDNGLIVQSVCLAAHNRGLGTCIMGMAVRDPDLLREILPGAAGKRFVIGVALGYPDLEAPVNQFERPRVPLEELVTWAE